MFQCCWGLCGGGREEAASTSYADNMVMLDPKKLWQPQGASITVTGTHASGTGQVFPESQLSEMKMLAMNQMQLAPPTLTDGASKLSTIQGVEYAHLAVDTRRPSHIPEPLQPTSLLPCSLAVTPQLEGFSRLRLSAIYWWSYAPVISGSPPSFPEDGKTADG